MANIILDTRILSEDHKVFVLHPGKGKKFYAQFHEQGAVFLDLPGIELPEQLDIQNTDHRAQLRMARRISTWYRAGCPLDKEPSRRPADHESTLTNVMPKYVHEAEYLYRDAAKGDLVVVSGPGYRTPVLIGEFVDSPEERVRGFATIYGEEPIPARKVVWLSDDRIKARFSERLIQLMQNRSALIQMTHSFEKKEVYDLAYGDYSIRGTRGVGRVLVTKPHIDFKVFAESSELVSYFISIYCALDKGQGEELFGLSDVPEAINQFYDSDYVTDVSIDIRSPGQISIQSPNILLPAFVSVMLTLTTLGVDMDSALAAGVSSSQSSEEARACEIEMTDRVRETMNMMHFEHWQEICERAQAAKEAIGLDSSVTIGGEDFE